MRSLPDRTELPAHPPDTLSTPGRTARIQMPSCAGTTPTEGGAASRWVRELGSGCAVSYERCRWQEGADEVDIEREDECRADGHESRGSWRARRKHGDFQCQ
jgi:hypothetical protein